MYLLLKNKKITIGISGGIAAYKIPFLIRLLKKEGAEVQCVVTKSAFDFVTETLLFRLTNKPVLSPVQKSSWHEDYHITIKNNTDLFVLAPATLNCIGKITNGIADDPLTTVVSALFAKKIPMLFAPAMNTDMWNNPILQENIEKLKKMGIYFCGPEIGELACGEVGLGKMSEPEGILEHIQFLFSHKRMLGKKVLITAGPTQEFIDPIRYISNISTGARGYAIAKVFAREGAHVSLISGPSAEKIPSFVHSFKTCISAQEMFDLVSKEIKADTYDYFISVAAVADSRPTEYNNEKIPKQELKHIELHENPDILGIVSSMRNSLKKDLKIIGFALQTNTITEVAKKKLQNKGLDLVIANTLDTSRSSYNQVTIIDKDFNELPISGSNEYIAEEIIQKLFKSL